MAGKVGNILDSVQIGDVHGPGFSLHAGQGGPNMTLVFVTREDANRARELIVDAFEKAKAISANR